MNELQSLENILFLDVETVSEKKDYTELAMEAQALYAEKVRFIAEKEDKLPNELYNKAGIYAEFGKVVCITCAFIEPKTDTFRLKSFYGHNEKEILIAFCNVLNQFFTSKKQAKLCAHNGKEFDFPFLGRRMLINDIALPYMLNLQGKKPWEIPHLDTLELWKFGDYKHYTSLNLLAYLFKIPSPKNDIKGSDVSRVYWEENNLERIAIYCQKDVITLINVFCKLNGLPLINSEKIKIQEADIFN